MPILKSIVPLMVSAIFLPYFAWSAPHFTVNSSTVALWTFNSRSGTNFTDLSTNALALSGANNFNLTVSPNDSAAIFTGSATVANSYLSHANVSSLTMAGTGKLTYEARVFLTQAQLTLNNGGWLIGTYDGPQLMISSNGALIAGGQKSNGSDRWWAAKSVAGVVPLNTWVDIAVAYDQTTGQAYGYINGTPIQLYNNDGTALTDPFRVSAGAFYVGNNGRDNYQFRGTIEEIRVSNNLVLGAGLNVINAAPPTITVPSNLSYANNPATYAVNVAITNNVPTALGGPTRYTVSPALPTGLKLDSISGIISGTPTTLVAAINYTVTASNSLGSTSAVVNIAVVTAPSGFSYSANPVAYYRGTAITPNTPTVTGTVTSFSVSPALPAGLTLNTTTGVISGTPTIVAAAANYTISANNGQVSITVTVNIAVVSAPITLSYSANPALYGLGVAITANNPTVTGTTPITYTVSPALPAGLSLNANTGVISGTPTVRSVATNYTVTATNIYGSTTASLSITVLIAPSGFSYAVNPAQYVAGIAITPNTPTIIGTVTNYSVSPALPPGIFINATTGIISGTPATQVTVANYVVTASNAAGSATITLTIGVSPSVGISFNGNRPVFRFNISESQNFQLLLSNSSKSRLEIVELSGKKIWSKDVDARESGFVWNRLASDGNRISAGNYFLRVVPLDAKAVLAGTPTVQRITLAR